MPEAVFAGTDVGAESGRVVVGRLGDGRASVDLMGRVGLETYDLGIKRPSGTGARTYSESQQPANREIELRPTAARGAEPVLPPVLARP